MNRHTKKYFNSILFLFIPIITFCQVFTKEDSLQAGLIAKDASTVISGYGEAKYMYDVNREQASINLTRQILFIGHKFNNTFSLFSETELEDAKIEGGGASGELSLEQLFLKININRSAYLVTGLFIPRIGIINENHLPTTFNGNDRPFVERQIIPSTWRELGVALYGQINNVPGLNYFIGLTNGLKAENFEYGNGIRKGRQEGSLANATNLAFSGALLYYINNFRLQVSGYYGGASGLRKKTADSLQLEHGTFAMPVSLIEGNVQYHFKAYQFKALAALINISQAQILNQAYGKNTAEKMFGAYAEFGFDMIKILYPNNLQSLVLFTRYEHLNLQFALPSNAVVDNLFKQNYLVVGLNYHPIRAVTFKVDYVIKNTGEYNKDLHVFNPYEYNEPVFTNNNFINIGMAYSF